MLWGCIPAKALLESASIAEKVKKASRFGVNVGETSYDYGVAMKRSRAVAIQNSKGVGLPFQEAQGHTHQGNSEAHRKEFSLSEARRRQGRETRRKESRRDRDRLASERTSAGRTRAEQDDGAFVR